jgi:hypothetical protein
MGIGFQVADGGTSMLAFWGVISGGMKHCLLR